MEKKGTSNYVEKILRFISEENKESMNYFYLESIGREYKKVNVTEEIFDYIENDELTQTEIGALLNYSGYNFKQINAVLRDTWNYEENGNLGNMGIYRQDAEQLKNIIMEHPSKLQDNIMTYRGVDLSYFKQYGIETLEDLKSLEGRHLYDRGFVSTSLQEDKCFFGKDNELGLNYNVKIEYMIPFEFRDGIYLNANMSYTPGQQEYLINAANLSRVSSVTINEDNTAVIRTTLIPKEIYDDYYKNVITNQEQK